MGGIAIVKQSLDAIADAIIDKLRGKVVIHRYDAYSTNSIYLKFDYGVAYSLRISDHNGKEHLKYRYNILTSMSGQRNKKQKYHHGCYMYFYSPEMVKAVVRDILATKEDKKKEYFSYEAVVNAAKAKEKGRGFWEGAKVVSE